MKIPFNKPVLSGSELTYIADAIYRGQLSGDGHYTQMCEALIKNLCGVHSAHLTHSCTAALEMAAILCDLQPGDEVIMPSYTFVSTANAVALRGAIPVFVDIESDTLNIDPALISRAITDRTRAIYVVHYAGVVCDMKPIMALAEDRGLIVVEDAAQALGSLRDGRQAGSFGHFSAFSFHETKNIIAGEGGCLTTNSEFRQHRAEIIREKGTNRRAFLRGAVDKYTWVDIGSSYLPGELTSAFLYAQLENIESIYANRMLAWDTYHAAFAALELDNIVRRPVIPQQCQHNAHMYYLLMENSEERDAFTSYMRNVGIICPFHYVPLHSSPFGKSHTRCADALEVTDRQSQKLVRLPLYSGVQTDIDSIIESALKFSSFRQ